MKTKNLEGIIPSVNYHLWNPCNMRCKFCFATFQDTKVVLPKGHLPKEESLALVRQIGTIGFKKITFAGGEPTLCPWISELIKEAKMLGLTTMLVTNGTKLDDDFLSVNQEYLDWIILSVDSLIDETNLTSGRAIMGKKMISKESYKKMIDDIHQYHYRLKINTVVHQFNYEESLLDFIEYAQPERWKVFQVLPMKGENDEFIDEFKISKEQFEQFLNHHQVLKEKEILVSENNSEMMDSYAMIDPSGRFFTNKKGYQEYSSPILEVGIEKAYQEMNFNYKKFLKRGGLYDWENNLNTLKMMNTKITLSGEVASGKTTVGKLLAEKLNYNFISLGNLVRHKAENEGMSIVDFQKKCSQDALLDKEIDREFANDCNHQENLVIDYRLGFRFIKNAFHVFLKISEKDAVERLIMQKRKNETHETVRQRNNSFKEQFKNAYQIDYTLESNYDLVVEIDNSMRPEEIVDKILLTFKN